MKLVKFDCEIHGEQLMATTDSLVVCFGMDKGHVVFLDTKDPLKVFSRFSVATKPIEKILEIGQLFICIYQKKFLMMFGFTQQGTRTYV